MKKGRDKGRNKDGRETDGRAPRAGDRQGLPRQTDRQPQWGEPGDKSRGLGTNRRAGRPQDLGRSDSGWTKPRRCRERGRLRGAGCKPRRGGDTDVGLADQPPSRGSAQGCSGARWLGGFSGSPDQGCWPDPEMELRDPKKQEDGDPEVRGRR